MAKPTVHWEEEREPQQNPIRWSTSGGGPLPSPYPYTIELTDTDPSDDDSPAIKSILSIDGGGIRGYSSLIILQALMEEIGKIEQAHNPKATSSIYSSALGRLDDAVCAVPTPDAMPVARYRPCHYFDYIAGAGTGGTIAMMLGRCRMSVYEAMKKYRETCAMAVERQATRRRSGLSRKHKDAKWSLANTMKLVPAWASPNEDDAHLQSDPRRCCTIVCGCGPKLQPFRSDAISSPPRLVGDIIWQCVGAENSHETSYNNPSRTALSEVSSLPDASLPDHNLSEEKYNICLLSIGSAINDPRADGLQYKMSWQSHRVHEELESTKAHRFNLKSYYRLDAPGDDLHEIGVNEWKPGSLDRFDRIKEATNRYLQNGKTANEIHDCATILVEKRRRRAETLQWERWALGVFYRCPKLKCDDWNERFDDSAGFWVHMRKAHGVKHADYDEATEREYDEYEAMGRTREESVSMEINVRDLVGRGSAWKDIEKKIEAAKKKRGRDLRALAKEAAARREVEEWIEREE